MLHSLIWIKPGTWNSAFYKINEKKNEQWLKNVSIYDLN